MESSLLRRNILDCFELIKITHQYQNINCNIGEAKLELQITKKLNIIEYKLLLNNQLLFLKQEGKNISKEEYYILNVCVYNDLNNNGELIYQNNNDNYMKYQIKTSDVLFEIFKINNFLEDILNSKQNTFNNIWKPKIKQKEI